jgi:hypothetical protein
MKRTTEEERRASFAQANASCAIEGLQMDAADLAIQERIVRGEITHEEAISESVRKLAVPPSG